MTDTAENILPVERYRRTLLEILLWVDAPTGVDDLNAIIKKAGITRDSLLQARDTGVRCCRAPALIAHDCSWLGSGKLSTVWKCPNCEHGFQTIGDTIASTDPSEESDEL